MYETIFSGNIGTKWVKFFFSEFGILKNSTSSKRDNRPRFLVGESPPNRNEVGAVMSPNEENEFAKGQTVWVRSGQQTSLITHMERKPNV